MFDDIYEIGRCVILDIELRNYHLVACEIHNSSVRPTHTLGVGILLHRFKTLIFHIFRLTDNNVLPVDNSVDTVVGKLLYFNVIRACRVKRSCLEYSCKRAADLGEHARSIIDYLLYVVIIHDLDTLELYSVHRESVLVREGYNSRIAVFLRRSLGKYRRAMRICPCGSEI